MTLPIRWGVTAAGSPIGFVFDELLQVLRFGCSYEGIADSTCSATTIRNRRDEWIRLGIFTHLEQIVLEAYVRIVGLILANIAVDGGRCPGRSPRRCRRASRRPVGPDVPSHPGCT